MPLFFSVVAIQCRRRDAQNSLSQLRVLLYLALPRHGRYGKKKGNGSNTRTMQRARQGQPTGANALDRAWARQGEKEKERVKKEREMERMNWRALAAAASPSRVARGVLRRPCWNCCLSWRADGRCGEKPKQRRSRLLYGAAAPKSAQSHAATRLVPIGPSLALFFPLFLLVARVSVGRTVCLALAAACAVALSRVPFFRLQKISAGLYYFFRISLFHFLVVVRTFGTVAFVLDETTREKRRLPIESGDVRLFWAHGRTHIRKRRDARTITGPFPDASKQQQTKSKERNKALFRNFVEPANEPRHPKKKDRCVK